MWTIQSMMQGWTQTSRKWARRFKIDGRALLLVAALLAPGGALAGGLSSGGLALDAQRDLAFVADVNSLTIVDISNRASPSLLSSTLISTDPIQDLFYDASREVLFVAADDSGLIIIDVRDPAAPSEISRLTVLYSGTPFPVRAVTLSGDFACVATQSGGLHSIDVSNLNNPVQAFFTLLGGTPTSDVHFDNGLVYVAGAKLARFLINGTGGFQSAGQNYASTASVIVADGDRIFSTPTSNIAALQIHSTASGFPFVSSTDYEGSNVRDLIAVGDTLYTADPISGFRIFGLADLSTPTLLAVLPDTSAVRVAIQGDFAYLATYQGLVILDVSDPTNPVLAGQNQAVPGMAASGTALLIAGLLLTSMSFLRHERSSSGSKKARPA